MTREEKIILIGNFLRGWMSNEWSAPHEFDRNSSDKIAEAAVTVVEAIERKVG